MPSQQAFQPCQPSSDSALYIATIPENGISIHQKSFETAFKKRFNTMMIASLDVNTIQLLHPLIKTSIRRLSQQMIGYCYIARRDPFACFFAVSGLTLKGLISGFSEAQADIATTQSIPGLTTFDADARYTTQISGSEVTFRANIMNLVNKDYWNSVSPSFITIGSPPTALTSATIDF